MTPEGLELLKRFEGFRGDPYTDVAGILTVGYGTTFPLSQNEGELLLNERADVVEQQIAILVKVAISPHQLDALVSFVYNVGITAFEDSTLLRLLNEGRYDAVPAQLRRWVHAGGRVVAGLRNRRESEIALWSLP